MINDNSYKIKNIRLSSWIIEICKKKNIFYLTSTQQAIIPAIINGKDSIVFSRTGTGKTLSFILPLIDIEYIYFSNCFIGIITPTLELGVQIYETYNFIGRRKKISTILLDKKFKNHHFKEKKNCWVFTPFSINKFLNNNSLFPIYKRSILVFDEVDILIRPENFFLIKKITMKTVPSQINLFGVTNSNVFSYLGAFLYKKNIFFYNEKHNRFNFFSEIKHEYIYCKSQLKFKLLLILLKSRERNKIKWKENNPILIFTKNQKMCKDFAEILKKNKIFTNNLHHEMNDFQRILSVQMVKKGVTSNLITTDLASRGVNFSFMNFIVNLDIPTKTETYANRIGRIGRFKKKGYCLNIVNKHEINFIHEIEKNSGIRINKANLFLKKKTHI